MQITYLGWHLFYLINKRPSLQVVCICCSIHSLHVYSWLNFLNLKYVVDMVSSLVLQN